MSESEQLKEILKELKELKQNQNEIDKKISKIGENIKDIKFDIYGEEDDDENFDFEIVCPYCEYEFPIEADEELETVKCPNCNNEIELDWTGGNTEGSCNGHCGGCHGCSDDDEDM